MTKKSTKRTYMKPETVPDMSSEDLLDNCKWLIESQVARYCKFADKHETRDAKQQAALVILKMRSRYDPTYGVHFEGWVRIRIAAALRQLRLDAETPVRIDSRSSRRLNYKPAGVSVDDETTGLSEQIPMSVIDDSVVRDEKERGVVSLHAKIQERIEGLPPESKILVTAYLAASEYHRRCATHAKGRALCAELVQGLKDQFNDCVY